MDWNGVRVGHVVPGLRLQPLRAAGAGHRASGGRAVPGGARGGRAPADLVLIEGITNVDENAHLLETDLWGRLYLAITKWFARNLP